MKYEQNFTILRNLNEGDSFITKANTECLYLKKLGDDKHLIKDIGYNATPVDGIPYVVWSIRKVNPFVPSGKFPIFKKIEN